MFNGLTHSIFSFNKFRTNLKQVETIQRKQQELQYLENLKQKRIQMEKERIEALENEKKMEKQKWSQLGPLAGPGAENLHARSHGSQGNF